MDQELHDFGKEMMHLMPKFFRVFAKQQTKILASGDITMSQMFILGILRQEKSCKMSDMANILSISTSAATGIVDRMVKADLLKRSADSSDRRVINIETTKKGRDIIDDIMEQRHKMIIELFAKLTAVERKRYLEIIKKLCIIMDKERERDETH